MKKGNIEPKIVKKSQMKFIGRVLRGDVKNLRDFQDGGQQVEIFNDLITKDKVLDRIPNRVNENECVTVCIDYGKAKGYCAYMVGAEVHSFRDIPEDMESRIIPAAEYAVFDIESEDKIPMQYEYIMSEWLPGSTYEMADISMSIELYRQSDWKGQIWIPIVLKEN